MKEFIRPIWISILLLITMMVPSCSGFTQENNTTIPKGITSRQAADTPRLIGFAPTLCAEDVAVYGKYAYIADGPGGLKIINVTDPAIPSLVLSINTEYAFRVYAHKGYLYLCDGPGGMHIYSLNNPANPTPTYSFQSKWACGLAFNNAYLYFSDYHEGIKIFDLTDPGHPELDMYYITAHARDVAVNGSTLVMSEPAYGLSAYYLETATTPKYKYIDFSSLASFEDIVAHKGYGIIARNDDASNISVFTISDPDNINPVDVLHPARFIAGMTGCGEVLLAACGEDGVIAFDMHNPPALELLWTIDTTGYARRAKAVGNLLFVADMAGLGIYDLSGLGGEWN